MPDYKELYLKQFRATERAIQILIDVQRECEEQFLAETEMEDLRKRMFKLDNIKNRRPE